MLSYRQDVFFILVVMPLMMALTVWTLIYIVIAMSTVKVYASLNGLYKNPLETLSTIPDNWRRVVLCTDIATPAEILPGINEFSEIGDKSILRSFRISEIRKAMNSARTQSEVEGAFTTELVTRIFAIAYRYSLKSTALVWSPLIWIFRPVLLGETALEFAKGVRDLGLYKIVRSYSFAMIALFAGKLYILFFWLDLVKHFHAIPGWKIAEAYLLPERLPIWQIAAFINALLTITIYVKATSYLHMHECGKTLPRGMSEFFQISFYVRNCLAVYTSLCVSYITIMLAFSLKYPSVRPVFFPW